MLSLSLHLIRLVKLGNPVDYSDQKGNIAKGVQYSITGAMSPKQKESAYLFLPTYTAGLMYHFGTFLSIFLFLFLFTGIEISTVIVWCISAFLSLSVISGLGILFKRILKKNLRYLSNPDDFISNILVTLFQIFTIIVVLFNEAHQIYYISVSLLLIYMPLSKLKHTLYFFAARYHLGFFYGWRGVWPPK